MRFLAKSLYAFAAILTLALPAAAGETPAEQPSGKVPDCVVQVESPVQQTPRLTPAKLPLPPEVAWLACSGAKTETTSAGCGGGKACRYERTCYTNCPCTQWVLVSFGGCGACPTP